MHIADLLTTDSSGNPKTTFTRGQTIFWRFLVVDRNGSTLSGASVAVSLINPNNASSTFTSTTRTDGWALFTTSTKKNTAAGVYTIHVNSVAKPEATYDQGANLKTSTTFKLQVGVPAHA
jgi:uncharacterized protein YfaS (alpha-2-macroglobulin family)